MSINVVEPVIRSTVMAANGDDTRTDNQMLAAEIRRTARRSNHPPQSYKQQKVETRPRPIQVYRRRVVAEKGNLVNPS